MAIRTITLKLHNPSRRKREIIDKAMLNYSSAYQYLLDRAFKEIDHIRKKYRDARGGYRGNRVAKWVDKAISRELNKFQIEPFKDSLKIDFGMTMASYLNLNEIQQNVCYPIAYLPEEIWQKKADMIVDELAAGRRPLWECEREIKKIIEKSASLKPLFFCRYALNRDYCLLYDSVNNRYYAKIYLLNVKSKDRKHINVNGNRKLWYICKDSKTLENTGRMERFLLFPLSFGKWQERYLKEAIANPEMLKTARLIKKNDEYYLAVNIQIEEAEKIKTNTFLGVARALTEPLHYTIIDSERNVIDSGFIAAEPVEKKAEGGLSLNEIHRISNAIVKLALENKSQVIVESLVTKGDRLQWSDRDKKRYMPVLNCFNYNRLTSVLEYKLAEKGLPPPVKVSPVKIFYSCPRCGLSARQNRFSKDMFICTACGLNMDIERLGSLNLAGRLCEYSKGALKVKVEKTLTGLRFVNEILGLDLHVDASQDYREEFVKEVQGIIREFHENIGNYVRNKHFKQKYSLIKTIEEEKDVLKLLRIV